MHSPGQFYSSLMAFDTVLMCGVVFFLILFFLLFRNDLYAKHLHHLFAGIASNTLHNTILLHVGYAGIQFLIIETSRQCVAYLFHHREMALFYAKEAVNATSTV